MLTKRIKNSLENRIYAAKYRQVGDIQMVIDSMDRIEGMRFESYFERMNPSSYYEEDEDEEDDETVYRDPPNDKLEMDTQAIRKALKMSYLQIRSLTYGDFCSKISEEWQQGPSPELLEAVEFLADPFLKEYKRRMNKEIWDD